MRRWIVLGLLFVAASWAGWTLLQRSEENTWLTTYGQAYSSFARANYPEAEQTLESLLPQTERWWPHSPHLLDTLRLLAMSYRLDNKYDQAKPLFQRALQLSGSVSSPDNMSLGRIKLGLAIIEREQGNNDMEAERLFSEALPVFETNPSAARGDDAATMLNLGYLYGRQGRYREAEPYLTRAIARYQAILGTAIHPDLANAYFQLGEVYLRESRYADAAKQYQSALTMYEQLEGPAGENTSHAVSRLSMAMMGQGKKSIALQLAMRSEKIAKSLPAGDARSEAAILGGLASIAEGNGKYTEAESLYKRALAADERSLGLASPDVATALRNLGCLYRDREQFNITQAEPLLKRALVIREKALGPEHPDTAASLSDLSLLYFYEKKFAAAEKFAQRPLPIQEKVFGPNGLEVSTALNRLGIAERELGNLPAAETTLKRALAIREKNLGPNHPWIAVSLENLACVYVMQNELGKAAPLIIRARTIRSHPSGS